MDKDSRYFHIKSAAINSKIELEVALASGKIVYAAMRNGKFVTLFWNQAIIQAIILFNYNNGKTCAYDPLSIMSIH